MMPTTHFGRMRAIVYGLTGKQLVERVQRDGLPGFTLNRLRGLEHGVCRATREEREAIARALGCRTFEVHFK